MRRLLCNLIGDANKKSATNQKCCEENRDIDEHQDYKCANYAQGKMKLVCYMVAFYA